MTRSPVKAVHLINAKERMPCTNLNAATNYKDSHLKELANMAILAGATVVYLAAMMVNVLRPARVHGWELVAVSHQPSFIFHPPIVVNSHTRMCWHQGPDVDIHELLRPLVARPLGILGAIAVFIREC